MRLGIWMLVGIFEKSRRVRTARNSLLLSGMSSPVARPQGYGACLARGARSDCWSGDRFSLDLPVRPFGSDRPRYGHAQGAVCCSPRSILRGPNLVFRFHTGSCYKCARRDIKVLSEQAASGFDKDAESALRARMPGERGMIS